jgi:hypothetical protein
MGGVSPVLYRPVVPAQLVKISADAQFSAPAQIFTISSENSKILSRLLSVPLLPRKFVYDHCCWPNLAIILTVLKMEAILEFGRGCQNLLSPSPIILITLPQAVRQMCGVGRGEGTGG